MTYDKHRIRAVVLKIRRVLVDEWDPIGIKDEPAAQDEYDSYLGGIYRLLYEGADELKLATHLRDIEISMSLRGQSAKRLEEVARMLKRISCR